MGSFEVNSDTEHGVQPAKCLLDFLQFTLMNLFCVMLLELRGTTYMNAAKTNGCTVV